MYRAYALNLYEINKLISKESVENPFKLDTKILEYKLQTYIKNVSLNNRNPRINAATIWDDIFPEITADIFISHSGANKAKVVQLSNWLWNNFQIKAFIDSDFWGCISNLQKSIDKEYCRYYDKEIKRYLHSYEQRNISTAHVHMILSYALTRMIDKTECFFFLKSEESVSINDYFENTKSPWIFHELATVDTIRIKDIQMKLVESQSSQIAKSLEAEELEVGYPVLGNRLIELPVST